MSSKVSLRRYRNAATPELQWTVSWPSPEPGAPRKRRRFKTKTSANDFRITKEAEIQRAGVEGAALKDEAIREAIWAIEKLKPYGVSLRDAVTEWIVRKEGDERSITVREAIPTLIAQKRKAGRSQRHLATMTARLGRFEKQFGDRMLSGISAPDIENWLNDQNLGPTDWNNFRLYVSGLFSWGLKNGYARANPVSLVDTASRPEAPVEILTPSELRIVLNNAPPELLPFFALGAFAGLRSSEIERLDWRSIDFLRSRIDVQGKRGKSRFVPISQTLQTWLEPVARPAGKVTCPGHKDRVRAYRKELSQQGVEWRNNVLRHSFGSYEFARIEDLGKVAFRMGNSPSMVLKHYRERVTPEDAAGYFSIHPEDGKIINSKEGAA